jgi:hypothetical protein
MNHNEVLPYSYRGFHEGEYLHRYFLPESLKSEISPRDLLVVYWILRGFTPGAHPRQIRPAAFRDASSIRHSNDRAMTLLDNSLTINYIQEKFSKVIQIDQVSAMVAACRSYILAITDTDLNEAETDQLIGLNEHLKGLQHEVTKRIMELTSSSLKIGHKCDLKAKYSFELCDNDPDYRELDHNTLFSFVDESITLDAGRHEVVIEEIRQREAKSWNDNRRSSNRLYRTSHGWLFHRLEDWSAVPLRHLLKIGRMSEEVNLQFAESYCLT